MEDHRKVYARGFFDGVNAGKRGDPIWKSRKDMNAKIMESTINGLSAIAKKVYDAVPIEAPYNTNAICAAMRQAGCGTVDIRTVQGCLNGLIADGLIKEPNPGRFIKPAKKKKQPEDKKIIEFAETSKPHIVEKQEMTNQIANKPQGKSAIELLSDLSDRVSSLSKALKQIVDDIDAAAIELSDSMKKNRDDAEKLKQLQALLKSIGD